jgi:phage terminase large subunit-like protein
MNNKHRFNFYITTDFATSKEEASDFSVISVWAYNNNGDWLWVDGVCKRQLMDKNVDDLFRLAQMFRPLSVGIEVSGQQGGFIPWIMGEMMTRNIYFTLASENNKGDPGLRPVTNKLVRFNIVVPLFKARKMFFPIELRSGPALSECMNEISLASRSGFKSKKDDFIDTISQLASLVPWRPTEEGDLVKDDKTGIWELDEDDDTGSPMDSYVV